jgi:hypothetical protein
MVMVALAASMLFAALLAGTPPPNISSGAEDGVIGVSGRLVEPGSTQGRAAARVRTVYLYLPACDGNDPNTDRPPAGCVAAATMCATTPEPADLMFWRFSAVRSPDGSQTPWQSAGSVCLRAEEVPAAAVPAFTAADFRRLPLPPATLNIQPGSGRTLVNVATNFYASSDPQTFHVTLLGTPVTVRATPQSWSWTYGDGERRVFTEPGGPYPNLDTAHTFLQPGDYTVSLTTTWTGTYSVAGGPFVPVDGTAAVTSPTATVTAVATRAELVADTRPPP